MPSKETRNTSFQKTVSPEFDRIDAAPLATTDRSQRLPAGQPKNHSRSPSIVEPTALTATHSFQFTSLRWAQSKWCWHGRSSYQKTPSDINVTLHYGPGFLHSWVSCYIWLALRNWVSNIIWLAGAEWVSSRYWLASRNWVSKVPWLAWGKVASNIIWLASFDWVFNRQWFAERAVVCLFPVARCCFLVCFSNTA